MIRCIILDDEPIALQLIESYIAKTPLLTLVGSYTNAFEVLKILQTERVDLLFIDIMMPEITGIEVAASLDTFKTKVVFITAFDQYALDGFRVDAIDYLLKPVSYADFLRSTQKARRLIEQIPSTEGQLVVKSGLRLMKIDYTDILYLESARDYVLIERTDHTQVKTLSTLKGLESTLPCPPFHRVHRSFIVNRTKITLLERNQLVFGKKTVPVSEAYRADFYAEIGVK